jgi:putative ABC transport system permease protein
MSILANVVQDTRFCLRQFRQRPGFAVTAILLLGAGLGANAAIFSVVNAALIHPLSYPGADRLVLLFERDVVEGHHRNVVSAANFLDWQAQSRAFRSMAAARENSFTLRGQGASLAPDRVTGAIASHGLFATLGVRPLLGRTFSESEDRPGAERVAVIGYSLWQGRFGGDPDILAKTIRLDGQNCAVIGVMPPGFEYPHPGIELWRPLQQELDAESLHVRGMHQFYVVGRLANGVSLEQARAELDGIEHAIFTTHPGELAGSGATVIPLATLTAEQAKTSVLVLFGAVACVLLIACVNIANLLLARASNRQREMAIRAAVGASRGRLVRQLMTEAVLLSLCGAVLGLLLASSLTDVLAARAAELLNRGDIETTGRIHVDWWVFLFTAASALAAGVAAGLVPAFQAARTDVNARLKEGGRALTAGRLQNGFRNALISGEVAVSLVLLIAAGLLLRSFLDLRGTNPGVRTDHLLTAGLSLPDTRYEKREQVAGFVRQLAAGLQSIPGVRAAGLVSCLPVAGYCGDSAFYIEGRPLGKNQFIFAMHRDATPDYFAAAGIPILRGRALTERDGTGFERGHPRPSAVVISQAMATRFWPDGDALGKRIYFDNGPGAAHYQIVGIAGDVRFRLDEQPRPTLYLPLLDGSRTSFFAVLHTSGDPESYAGAVRQVVRRLDEDVPVFRARGMEAVLAESAGHRRFTMLLVGLFAAVALGLAAIGLYGVLSYLVAQRTGEIGVRVVLGAGAGDVQRMVLGQGMKPVLAGMGVGLAGAVAATGLFRTLLFGVGPRDPATFVGVTALLLLVSLAACSIPAIRATRVDPARALRNE